MNGGLDIPQEQGQPNLRSAVYDVELSIEYLQRLNNPPNGSPVCRHLGR